MFINPKCSNSVIGPLVLIYLTFRFVVTDKLDNGFREFMKIAV